MAGSISQRQRRQYTKARSSQLEKEQDERTVYKGFWRHRVATNGFGVLLFLILLCS